MNLSEQDAKELLASISDTTAKTRRAVVRAYASPVLMLWGTVWTLCYLGSHFFSRSSQEIWIAGSSAGVAGIIYLLVRESRRGPTIRNAFDKSLDLRVILFWLLISAFAFGWIAVLRPDDGIRLNAFLCMVGTFGCIVMGLWFCIWTMVVMGIAVTLTTLVGCFAIHPMHYALWMAVTAGGSLLGTGLYMHLKWR